MSDATGGFDPADRHHRRMPTSSTARRGIDGKIYPPEVENDLNLLCARVLGTPDGQRLLNYLRGITLNVAFEADVGQNALMHMEGQRWLVGLLVKRTAKGNEP